MSTSPAGKGDKDRSSFKKDYKGNFDNIKWSKKEAKSPKRVKNKMVYTY